MPNHKRDKSGRSNFTITFTKEQIAPAEETALKKLGSSVKIEGFRPGKVPPEMLKERVSPDQLLEETIRALLPDTIKNLVEENELKPIIPPKVEAKTREPLTLGITFVEHPDVTLKGADKIKVGKKDIKVEEKDVERMIGYILEQHQKTKEADRKAKKGDRVTMDFTGKDKDGKEIEGIKTKGHCVILGSKTLIPGFEEQLMGLGKGDEKTFTLTFPKKYHAERLQDKPVTFSVKINLVEEVQKPRLTDAFSQEHLDVESAESFKKRVKNSMEEQERRVDRQRRENELFKKIREATKVELAEELTDEEERDILEQLVKQLKEKNLEFEDWLKQSGKKIQDVKREFQKQAKDRLTLRLGLQSLVEQKGISVEDKEMEEIIADFLAPLSGNEREKIEPMYRKGRQGWDQMKWQRKVEKLIDLMLT